MIESWKEKFRASRARNKARENTLGRLLINLITTPLVYIPLFLCFKYFGLKVAIIVVILLPFILNLFDNLVFHLLGEKGMPIIKKSISWPIEIIFCFFVIYVCLEFILK